MSEGCSSESSHNYEIISNQRGKTLLHAGHEYNKHRENKTSTVWACVNLKKDMKCKGAVIVYHTSDLANIKTKHNSQCVPNFVKNEVKVAIDKCKQNICNDYNPIPTLYEKYVFELKDKGLNFTGELPEFRSVKSQLYRHRNKKLKTTKTKFTNPIEVIIPEEFQCNLLVDHCENENRILVFASENIKEIIKCIQHCFGDGTFKCCPKPFKQVYSIQGDMGSNENSTNIIPLFYVFLTNKEEETYRIMFDKIKEILPEWKPTKFTFDFETGARNAAEFVFPGIELRGCYVHFQRCLLKKAKSLNLMEHEETKQYVKQCMSLGYLPKQDIEDAWLFLMGISFPDEKVTEFNDYMVNEWLEPPGMIEKWCCYRERHRTTNLVEAWNSRFNKKIGRNSSFLLVLQTIKNDISRCNTLHERFSSLGAGINKRQKTSISNDKKILDLTEAYERKQITIDLFLKEMSRTISKYFLK